MWFYKQACKPQQRHNFSWFATSQKTLTTRYSWLITKNDDKGHNFKPFPEEWCHYITTGIYVITGTVNICLVLELSIPTYCKCKSVSLRLIDEYLTWPDNHSFKRTIRRAVDDQYIVKSISKYNYWIFNLQTYCESYLRDRWHQ